MKVGILFATKTQGKEPAPVRELYSKSALFRHGLAYCEKHYDKTLVFSIPFGLLELDEECEPVDMYFSHLRQNEYQALFDMTVDAFSEVMETEEDEIYLHGGKKFCDFIKDVLVDDGFKIYTPLEGVGGIGKQLRWYNQNT